MIIKLKKVISCSSEHPLHPASTLLDPHSTSSWRCAKPGEMLATVIFEVLEPACITGLDIGNYRSCVVIVEASTKEDPDNWVLIVNHQFLTNDEAANNKFRDQVQIFTKQDLNPEHIKTKFDRIKVTCMQPANPRELFGLKFIVFKTEVTVDLGLDVFGRFKLKNVKKEESTVDEFKEKYLKMFGNRPSSYKDDLKVKVKEHALQTSIKRQDEPPKAKKRPLLEKLEEGKTEEVFGKKETKFDTSDLKDNSGQISATKNNSKPIAYTPFGDPIPISPAKKTDIKKVSHETKISNNNTTVEVKASTSKRHSADEEDIYSRNETPTKRAKCSECEKYTEDKVCQKCGKLLPQKKNDVLQNKDTKIKKPKKEFGKLLEGVTFSLSGYVNPQRDSIRKKALQMGAKYIANPDVSNNKCTHLICAFKNTPKYQQLKGHSKIVSHTYIEDCYIKKTRLPWRRYALDKNDKTQAESEEEIEAFESTNVYDMDTEDDSDSNY